MTGNNSLLYCRIAVLPHWTHLPSHYPRSRSRFHCVTPLKRYKRWPRVCNAPRGRGWASAPRHRIPGSVSNLRPRRGARRSPHLSHPSLHGRGPHTGPGLSRGPSRKRAHPIAFSNPHPLSCILDGRVFRYPAPTIRYSVLGSRCFGGGSAENTHLRALHSPVRSSAVGWMGTPGRGSQMLEAEARRP